MFTVIHFVIFNWCSFGQWLSQKRILPEMKMVKTISQPKSPPISAPCTSHEYFNKLQTSHIIHPPLFLFLAALPYQSSAQRIAHGTFCFSTQKFMFITTPARLITQDLSRLCTFSLCLCWVVKLSSSLLSIAPWECIIEEKMTRRKESGKIFIN